MAQDSTENEIAETPLAELSVALKRTIEYFENHKVASILLLVVLYIFSGRTSFSTHTPGLSFDMLALAALIIVAVLQNPHFSWQVRFAYLQWPTLATVFEGALGGSTTTLALLTVAVSPLPASTILLAILVAWQFVLVKYHAGIRKVAAEGDLACYQAKLVIANSRAYANTVIEIDGTIAPIGKLIIGDEEEIKSKISRLDSATAEIYARNTQLVADISVEITELAISSGALVKIAVVESEKVKWFVDQANLLVKHGENVNAEYLLESAQQSLKIVCDAESTLGVAKTKAQDLDTKFRFEDIPGTHKKVLEQIRSPYTEPPQVPPTPTPTPQAPPIPQAPPAPQPPPAPQAPPAEPPKPVLPNKLTLKNPIAIAGSLSGAEEDVDDVAFKMRLPFPIEIYGHSTSIISINDNGMICLDRGPTNVRNERLGKELPNSAVPSYAIFPLWEDLMIKKGKPHGIYYEIEGTSPNRTMTIEWYVTRYDQQDMYFHFLVILEEARPSVVTFKYFDVNDKGVLGTVGVQGARNCKVFSVHQPKVLPGLQLIFNTTPSINSLEQTTFQLPGAE